LLAVPAVRPKPAWGGIGVAIRGRPIETAFCDPRPSSLPTANKQGWRGHLWQGRFASFVMDEPYLLVTARYVELNPVRAGLVEAPSEYPWSSARAHLAGRDDGLVQVAPLLELAPNWRRLLTSAVTEGELKVLRAHERTARPCGDDDSLVRLEKNLGRVLWHRKPGRKRKQRQKQGWCPQNHALLLTASLASFGDVPPRRS